MPQPPHEGTPKGERTLGWILVALQFALIGVIAVAPRGGVVAWPDLLTIPAVVLLAAGLGLALWGAFALGRALTPHPSPRPGAPLLRSGPFALVPHPIYVGLAAAGLAAAVLREGAIPLGAALALCLLLLFKAQYEGRLLRRAHASVG